MLEKILIGISSALLNGLFKKPRYALWVIKINPQTLTYDKPWAKLGEGTARRLKMYEPTLFGEGWRTLIIPTGITPMIPPNPPKVG